MSRVPFLLDHARFDGYRLGHGKLIDAMYRDGFHCPISDMLMGETAEKLAQIHKIAGRSKMNLRWEVRKKRHAQFKKENSKMKSLQCR